MSAEIIVYLIAFGMVALIFIVYLTVISKRSRTTNKKIETAKESGTFEPVSLHPVIDTNLCIGSGACIEACPERDILGWANGKSKCINTSRCVGHGACFHACPVEAISLVFGTEKRGTELPHVSQEFESNIPLLYIAGELGGMGLIKNAVQQGRQAVEYLTKKLSCSREAQYDLIIIGAGPAGISATLTAKKNNLRFLTLDQDTIGGTVASFPRAKIIMTSPMEVSLYGKVKFRETSKQELITFWTKLLNDNEIVINQEEKVIGIEKEDSFFQVVTAKSKYTSQSVLLAIGRRGSPRKLGVEGEEKEKVFYRLLEPELISNKNVLVVGGGDSAIESAILLADENNNVTLSYRSEKFGRIKSANFEKINAYSNKNKVQLILNSTVTRINDHSVILKKDEKDIEISNDLVYVFIGGELPTEFLNKVGIKITKKFGEVVYTHNKK